MTDKDTPPHTQERQIGMELVRFLYGQSLFILIGSVLIALLVTVLLWDTQAHRDLLLWVALVAFFAGTRYAFGVWGLPKKPDEAQVRLWRNIFILVSTFTGLTWGGGLWYFTDSAHPFESAVLVIIAAGMTSTSFASTSSYSPATSLVYSLGTMGTLAVGYASTGERYGLFIALLNIIYIAMLRLFAGRNHRNMVEQIRLRLETAQLAEELEHQHALAESANIAKSRFLAAASHDLRQPLQAVTIFSTLLAEGLREGEHRETVTHLQTATDSLTRLFNTLLDISLLDAGKLKPQLRDMALGPLIERLHNDYREQATAQQLGWQVECGELAVHSDPALLENILRNLISNALRYTPHGTVALTCTLMESQIEISVRDTGIGIPADELEAIFEEFHQAGNPERNRQQGLGLGLAIVQRTAALIGAAIAVQSESGKGSRFTLTVPQAHAPLVNTTQAQYDAPLNGLVVAVVDDEADIREGFANLLGQWGCTVVVGESLAGVERALEDYELLPQVILSDYRLRDGQNGVAVVEGLRARYGKTLPALIITGETAPERLQQINQYGLPVLQKPVAPARLRAFLLRQQR